MRTQEQPLQLARSCLQYHCYNLIENNKLPTSFSVKDTRGRIKFTKEASHIEWPQAICTYTQNLNEKYL